MGDLHQLRGHAALTTVPTLALFYRVYAHASKREGKKTRLPCSVEVPIVPPFCRSACRRSCGLVGSVVGSVESIELPVGIAGPKRLDQLESLRRRKWIQSLSLMVLNSTFRLVRGSRRHSHYCGHHSRRRWRRRIRRCNGRKR